MAWNLSERTDEQTDMPQNGHGRMDQRTHVQV